MPSPIQITFMRYGRSRADDEMVHEGRYDSPLTDVGRAQVRSRAEQWKQSGATFVLIVAHGGILNAAMGCIVGVSPHHSVVRFAFGDACFVRTSYDSKSDQWTIREVSAQTD